jgi:hypothetical protein
LAAIDSMPNAAMSKTAFAAIGIPRKFIFRARERDEFGITNA